MNSAGDRTIPWAALGVPGPAFSAVIRATTLGQGPLQGNPWLPGPSPSPSTPTQRRHKTHTPRLQSRCSPPFPSRALSPSDDTLTSTRQQYPNIPISARRRDSGHATLHLLPKPVHRPAGSDRAKGTWKPARALRDVAGCYQPRGSRPPKHRSDRRPPFGLHPHRFSAAAPAVPARG